MGNKLYIDRVRVEFLDPNTRTDEDLYGLWVGDDYDEVPVLISTEEKDIPKTIQMVIRYLLREEEHQALELIKEHIAEGNGLYFGGREIIATRVHTILDQWEISPDL